MPETPAKSSSFVIGEIPLRSTGHGQWQNPSSTFTSLGKKSSPILPQKLNLFISQFSAAKSNKISAVQNQPMHKGVNWRLEDVTQTQQQRSELPTVTLTRHASKYKVHKFHHRYVLSCTNFTNTTTIPWCTLLVTSHQSMTDISDEPISTVRADTPSANPSTNKGSNRPF